MLLVKPGGKLTLETADGYEVCQLHYLFGVSIYVNCLAIECIARVRLFREIPGDDRRRRSCVRWH